MGPMWKKGSLKNRLNLPGKVGISLKGFHLTKFIILFPSCLIRFLLFYSQNALPGYSTYVLLKLN